MHTKPVLQSLVIHFSVSLPERTLRSYAANQAALKFHRHGTRRFYTFAITDYFLHCFLSVIDLAGRANDQRRRGPLRYTFGSIEFAPSCRSVVCVGFRVNQGTNISKRPLVRDAIFVC